MMRSSSPAFYLHGVDGAFALYGHAVVDQALDVETLSQSVGAEHFYSLSEEVLLSDIAHECGVGAQGVCPLGQFYRQGI